MLREYRKRSKLSQEELERLSGIDRKTIFRIENDLNMPILDTFARLALALKLSDKEIADIVKNSVLISKHTFYLRPKRVTASNVSFPFS